jgi:hypothetical protein
MIQRPTALVRLDPDRAFGDFDILGLQFMGALHTYPPQDPGYGDGWVLAVMASRGFG